MSNEDSHKIPEFYTNSVNMYVSPYDFTFAFGIFNPDGDSSHQFRVHMSPQHAKALKIVLDKFLEIYESQFVPIRLPEDLEARLMSGEDIRTVTPEGSEEGND